jgi:di/tripeptidase
MGGHSGLNINEDRGNAVRFAARIADTVLKAAPGAKLAGIAGGDKRNAIPREATATLLVRLPPQPHRGIAVHSGHKTTSSALVLAIPTLPAPDLKS